MNDVYGDWMTSTEQIISYIYDIIVIGITLKRFLFYFYRSKR